MAKFRNEMTNDEKLAVAALGTDSNFNMINMRENSIDALVEKEKAAKMNEQLEKFQEQMDKSHEEMKKSQDTIEYDINTAEIKPLFQELFSLHLKAIHFRNLLPKVILLLIQVDIIHILIRIQLQEKRRNGSVYSYRLCSGSRPRM